LIKALSLLKLLHYMAVCKILFVWQMYELVHFEALIS